MLAITLLATTLFAEVPHNLIPQSICLLLQELSIPIPDQTTLEKAAGNDQALFLNYLNRNFAPEYVQNIDPFVNKYKSIVKTLLQMILLCKNKKLGLKEAAERLRYEVIAYTYGFNLYTRPYLLGRSNQGWITLSGKPLNDSKKLWNGGIYEKNVNCRKALVQEYKIHLMPRDEDKEKLSVLIFKSLKENPEIKVLIPLIKTLVDSESLIKKKQLPKFVIYVTGKEAAEKVLAWAYETFKNIPGCGLAPQFNEKVTDLIFFAHGDRDRKKIAIKAHSWGQKIFEEPNMVYYHTFFTGEKQDYHLKNPAIMASK